MALLLLKPMRRARLRALLAQQANAQQSIES
jgi:hypothetical protein